MDSYTRRFWRNVLAAVAVIIVWMITLVAVAAFEHFLLDGGSPPECKVRIGQDPC